MSDYFNEYLVPDFEALDKELGSSQWFQRQNELNQLKMTQEQNQAQSDGQGTDPNQATLEQIEEAQTYRPTYNRKQHSETKEERLERVKEEYGRRPFISVGSTVRGFCKQRRVVTAKDIIAKHLELEKDGEYILPPLPYEYNALEPHIDEETMRLHHTKHHQKYVDDFNDALKSMSKLKKDDPQVRALTDKTAFNGSGHVLHSTFWLCLSPEGQKEPNEKSQIAKAIKEQFGSFKKLCERFMNAANTTQGSGWAILAVDHTGRLLILQSEKHHNLTVWGALPILVLDVWEHAYYLKYKNDRAAYVKAVCENLINWDKVNEFYLQALRQSK